MQNIISQTYVQNLKFSHIQGCSLQHHFCVKKEEATWDSICSKRREETFVGWTSWCKTQHKVTWIDLKKLQCLLKKNKENSKIVNIIVIMKIKNVCL